ncbi:hypothetical protein D3C72_2421730 [compost metagenome]
MYGFDGNDCPGRTYRVSERDARTIGVQLVRIQVQLLSYGTGLCCKCLVCLDDIDILNR